MQTHATQRTHERTDFTTDLELTCRVPECDRTENLKAVVYDDQDGVTFRKPFCRYHLKHFLGVSS